MLVLWVLRFCFGFCVSVAVSAFVLVLRDLCFCFGFCISVVGFVFLFWLLCLCCRNCVSVLFLSATVIKTEECQTSSSYRASKSRFFPYIHCKFCRVCPTTKMSSAAVKSSIRVRKVT